MGRGGGGSSKAGMFMFPLVVLLLEALFVVPTQMPAAHDAMNNFMNGVNAPFPSAPAGQDCGWNGGCAIGQFAAYAWWLVNVILGVVWKVILVIFFPLDLIAIMLAITFAVNAFLGVFNIGLVAMLIYSVIPMV